MNDIIATFLKMYRKAALIDAKKNDFKSNSSYEEIGGEGNVLVLSFPK